MVIINIFNVLNGFLIAIPITNLKQYKSSWTFVGLVQCFPSPVKHTEANWYKSSTTKPKCHYSKTKVYRVHSRVTIAALWQTSRTVALSGLMKQEDCYFEEVQRNME